MKSSKRQGLEVLALCCHHPQQHACSQEPLPCSQASLLKWEWLSFSLAEHHMGKTNLGERKTLLVTRAGIALGKDAWMGQG